MNTVEVHIPEARLHGYHRARRRFGCGISLGGLVLLAAGLPNTIRTSCCQKRGSWLDNADR